MKMLIYADEAYPVYDLGELPDYDVHPNLRQPIVDVSDEFKEKFDRVRKEYGAIQDELAEMSDKAEYVNVLEVQKQLRGDVN